MSLKRTVWLCVFGLVLSPSVWAQHHASNAPDHAHSMPNAATKSHDKIEPERGRERVYRSKKLRIHKHPHGGEHGKRGHKTFKRSERQGGPNMSD